MKRIESLCSLDGKHVLVTGASGAIGREAVHTFAEAGAKVLAVDRNQGPLDGLRAAGVLAGHLVGDLADPAFCDAVADQWPVVDVLVNNVGSGVSITLADTSDEQLDGMLDANLRPAVRLCRRLAPGMGERGHGKIINVSSVLAMHPVPTVAAYAAAKAALIGFTRSIALEYAPRHVQANVLAPGYLEGPKNAGYFASPAGRSFVDRFMPNGSVGRGDSLNGPLLFLASAMSDHVTGHVLVADGGYSIW
ncbi:SDR family NAD(P)-dependent oxidoreductase [Streptomyces caatingaensis]|uniref:SDR family NAD(P)-dependent oxidoreductase n=1 Tax=Streptomyces caatingaensis TaxID=1678637 RepID=UPI0006728414|nr:SDR family oxidoreductase [Streptomyces caatingaensis]